MLFQAIYSSRSTTPLSRSDLEAILDDARQGNEARGVSGALVYVDGVFLQVLEGEREAVLTLLESIRKDTRHDAMKVFYEAEIAARAFADWRMAYLTPSAEEMSEWAGLEGAGSAQRLLEQVQADRTRVPGILVNILEALVARQQRRGP